jgi:uncharacterized membrane protein YeaQ/YmgE (transglycosylase-associated protein family)
VRSIIRQRSHPDDAPLTLAELNSVISVAPPGPNNPSGFILTTALGIAGAFVATYFGQHFGWCRLDQGAGFIGASLGAVIVLFVWHRLVVTRTGARSTWSTALAVRAADAP